MSGMLTVLRRCNLIAKFAAPAVRNARFRVSKFSGGSHFIVRQKMTTIGDDILQDSKRNLDYNQLLEKKKNEGTVLIDVREHSEINETGKLPGSIHIPLNELEKALKDLSPEQFYKMYKIKALDPDTEVIFSCRSGGRSLRALKTALELGFKNAAHYKGGWLDWEANSKKNPM